MRKKSGGEDPVGVCRCLQLRGCAASELRGLEYPMLAEWSVELGADDPLLEIPWSSPDGCVRYLDIKCQPELLLGIPEACVNFPMAEFLTWANSTESVFETAKCDVWSSDEITPEEEIFGEPCKFSCYVDLLFTDTAARSQFLRNEAFVQAFARLLRRAPEMPASAEFIVRGCIDHRMSSKDNAGFYITFYLHGYGEAEEAARERWALALKMVQHAMIQQCAV